MGTNEESPVKSNLPLCDQETQNIHVASKHRVEDRSYKRLVKVNIPSIISSQCNEPPDLSHKGGSFFCTPLAENIPYYVRQTRLRYSLKRTLQHSHSHKRKTERATSPHSKKIKGGLKTEFNMLPLFWN